MTEKTKPAPPPPVDFNKFLADLDEGRLNAQLTHQLATVVRGVRETKKSGALTLTINLTQEGSMIVLKSKVGVKMPQPVNDASMYFAAENGALLRSDPRQQEMKDINKPAEPVPLRAVGPARSE